MAQATTQSAFLLRDGFPAYARPRADAAASAPCRSARGRTPRSRSSIPTRWRRSRISPTSAFSTRLGPRRAGRSGLHRQRQPSPDGERLLAEPGAARADGARRHAAAASRSRSSATCTLINPSIGKSSYHAGFVRVQKRFSDGFSFLAHYTRSRYMDDAESANEYGMHRQLHGRLPSRARLGARARATCRITSWSRCSTRCRTFTRTPFVNAVLGGLARRRARRRCSRVRRLPSSRRRTRPTRSPRGRCGRTWSAIRRLPSDERTLSRWFNTAAFAEPGAVHVRQLAALGAARPRHRDDGPDAREDHRPRRPRDGSTCGSRPTTCSTARISTSRASRSAPPTSARSRAPVPRDACSWARGCSSNGATRRIGFDLARYDGPEPHGDLTTRARSASRWSRPIVNGALGYGFSSITVPLALLFLANRVLNPALVLIEVVLNAYVLWNNRDALRTCGGACCRCHRAGAGHRRRDGDRRRR